MRNHLLATTTLACLASAILAARPVASPQAVRFLELPAYVAWCSSISVDVGENLESTLTDAWAGFLRTVDLHLMEQAIAASGFPYVARADLSQAEGTKPGRITQEACVVVPPDAKLEGGTKGLVPLVRKSIEPLERVAVNVCPNGTPAACLDSLRTELETTLSSVPRETIRTWSSRLVPFGVVGDEAAAIKQALLASDARPLAPPISIDGTIVADVPERGIDGKPVLRPLRTTPTGRVTAITKPAVGSHIAAVTVPATALSTNQHAPTR